MSVEDLWYIRKGPRQGQPTKLHGNKRKARYRVRNPATLKMRSFRKLGDAKAFNIDMEAGLAKGVTIDPNAGNVLFREYAIACVAKRFYTGGSLSTIQGRLNRYLLPFFGDLPMRKAATPSLAESWLAQLRNTNSTRKASGQETYRPLSARTVAAVYDLYATIMTSAQRDGVIGKSPCATIAYPKPPEPVKLVPWELAFVTAVLNALPEDSRAIGTTSAYCGARQGEAFGLGLADIRFLRQEILVRHQVRRIDGQLRLVPVKGGEPRVVPLSGPAAQALASHLEGHSTLTVVCECCGEPNELLFHDRHQMLSNQVWNERAWKTAVATAGLTPHRRTGQHQLRHFAAAQLLFGGASMFEVKEFLGHSSVTITERYYGHLVSGSAQRIRAIMGALAGESTPAQRRQRAGAKAGPCPERAQKIG